MAKKFEAYVNQPYDAFLNSIDFWFGVCVLLFLILGSIGAVLTFFNRNFGGYYSSPKVVASALTGAWFFNAIGYWLIVDFPVGAFLYKVHPTLHLVFSKVFYYASVIPVLKLVQ